ncbi:MAG TPA: MerR family transcriptional regulator [Pyrinomonadaceae bacterium]
MAQTVLKERGRKYVGLPEFARVSEQILAELGLEQERGTVTSVPDERTIRYYMAEGLIQTPEERQGTASVFGYLNLLQLLTVKKLQAEHLPIRKIRELVAGKSEQELEIMLGVSGAGGRKTDAKQYLETLLASAPSQPLREIAAVPLSPPQAAGHSHSWQRVEIEPGLELHVRSDYSPPASSGKTKSLLEKAIHRLRRLRG